MTIYKPKGEGGKMKGKYEHQSNESVSDGGNDDMVRMLPQPAIAYHQRCSAVLKCIMAFTMLLITTATVLGVVYIYVPRTNNSYKPWIETCRVHYHEWKTGSDGKEKSFLMEGEFYQQVEIDISLETYEKLNIPPVLNSRRSSILHDMVKGLTAVVDQDHGRCFITQINDTLVKPIGDFFDLVQSNKAGYYLPDTELIQDSYRLLKPAIEDVSQLGSRIYRECQFYDTYRLVRDDSPLEAEKSPTCPYQGERYCMGNAGSKYMLVFTISRCID